MRRRQNLILLIALSLCPHLSLASDLPVFASLHGDACTSFNIHWLAKKESSAEFDYRETGNDQWIRLTAEMRVFPTPGKSLFGKDLSIFIKRLENLKPGTRYELKLPNRDQILAVITQPEEPKIRRFLQGGDMMHEVGWMREMTQAVMKEARQNHSPEFALLGGDLAYCDGIHGKRWLDYLNVWFEETTAKDGTLLPKIVAIGNHEVAGAVGKSPKEAPFFYALFHLPKNQAHYVVDFGKDLSIILLDSYHTSHPKHQTGWLNDKLSQRTGVANLFACYHMPAYGSAKAPSHSNNPMDHGYARMMQEHYVPSFEKHGVDWVFEHDHHTYKRSHPMQGRKILEQDQGGVVYIGDGAWGVRTRDPIASAPHLAISKNTRHALIVDLTPSSRSYLAVDPAGKVFDRWGETIKISND